MYAFPLREQSLSSAEHKRIDVQGVFIHKLVLYQFVDKDTASIQKDVLARLVHQLAHLLDHVTTDKSRVSPGIRRPQRGGHDILVDTIHYIPERIARRHRLECTAVDLPGLASEQQSIGFLHRLIEVQTNIIVPVRMRSAAMWKPAIGIFIRAARRLNDAVQSYELSDNEFSHGFSF